VGLVVDDLGDAIYVAVGGGIGDGVLRGFAGVSRLASPHLRIEMWGTRTRVSGEEGGEDLEGVDHTSGAQDVEVVRGEAG
jgi:hypothetical protein